MASTRRRRGRFDGRALMAIRLAFARKFGRLPVGTDPVFFDPDAEQPSSLAPGGTHRLILEAMLENGTAPQLVYAYCMTGFPVSDAMRGSLPHEHILRWDMAIGEYFAFWDKGNHIQH